MTDDERKELDRLYKNAEIGIFLFQQIKDDRAFSEALKDCRRLRDRALQISPAAQDYAAKAKQLEDRCFLFYFTIKQSRGLS